MNEDKLEKLFQLQKKLNDYYFEKLGITTNLGDHLTMQYLEVVGLGFRENHGPNHITNEWLGKFSKALREELNELDECLLWKWWSKDSVNLQNVRVEIIDMLHFLISLAITAGLTANDVMTLYEKKNAVNIERQERGDYCQETKTEDDNKDVTLKVSTEVINIREDEEILEVEETDWYGTSIPAHTKEIYSYTTEVGKIYSVPTKISHTGYIKIVADQTMATAKPNQQSAGYSGADWAYKGKEYDPELKLTTSPSFDVNKEELLKWTETNISDINSDAPTSSEVRTLEPW